MATHPEPVIRAATSQDIESITGVHVAAFGGPSEANLVAALTAQCATLISLVALVDSVIVGHILFSPVRIEPATDVSVWGLAPMAVHPAKQGCGIGAGLVHSGIATCRDNAVEALVVLGHQDYYPRFGFCPASEFGLGCTYDVPPQAFMALELQARALREVAGVVHYHPVFAEL